MPTDSRPRRESIEETRTLPKVFLFVGLTAGVMCAAFASAGSAAVILFTLYQGVEVAPFFLVKTGLKALAFGLLAGSLCMAAARSRPIPPAAATDSKSSNTVSPLYLAAAFLCMILVLALVLPKLDKYPKTEPDELHHLIVARNISEHGMYASGHATTGLRSFDSYDSVGPPVLLPIAAAFKVAGPGLIAGRVVMAGFYLLLSVMVWLLIRPSAGNSAALMSIVFMAGAFGSVYLGRTLYGEVPALAFFVAGLVLWRRALNGGNGIVLCVGAGILWGVALLSKTILILAVWAFMAAWLHDRLSLRRLHFRNLIVPAITAGVILLLWWSVQSLYGDGNAAASTLGMYQHYLLFGFASTGRATRWLLNRPLETGAAAAGMLFAVPHIFHKRHDPALAVLFFVAVLFTFWWLFFTTGQIPRYLWYSFAVAALFAAWLMSTLMHYTVHNRKNPAKAASAICGMLVIATSYLGGIVDQASRVYSHDELADVRALAAYVDTVPNEAVIATDFWPVSRLVNFFNDRSAIPLDKAEDSWDIAIMNEDSGGHYDAGGTVLHRFGPYAVVERNE